MRLLKADAEYLAHRNEETRKEIDRLKKLQSNKVIVKWLLTRWANREIACAPIIARHSGRKAGTGIVDFVARCETRVWPSLPRWFAYILATPLCQTGIVDINAETACDIAEAAADKWTGTDSMKDSKLIAFNWNNKQTPIGHYDSSCRPFVLKKKILL